MSIELRKLIIKHTEDGKSVREISEIVKRSHSMVYDIIKRYKTNNQVENKPKKVHNKIFTEADERYLVRKVKVNPFHSAPKLAIIAKNESGKKASPSTIRNVLHKKNLTGRKARRKPFISKRNQKVRREFAKEHENKDFSYWKQVLSTDESKFNIFGTDGKPYVWRKSNEELRRQNLKPTVKLGGGSVMVWGSFSAAGSGTLCFIEGRMDQNIYTLTF
ncbi:transposable element Tc1 transposase [Trichonephila clavipes]|nr:transposable element Tc1 transposase [Trichonephila clavipes]